jgi:hypothetical protein
MDNPYGLRIATPEDAEALLAFVLPIYEESAAQAVSIPKVAALVLRCTNHDRAMAGIVAGESGEIEASVGAAIETFDYSDEPHLMVQWLGVAPAFRRSDRAARLTSFVQWLYDTMSVELDAPMPLFVPMLTTTEQRPKVMLLNRRLPRCGTLYALGCLPGRSFFDPSRAGKKEGGGRESPKAANVRSPSLDIPA